MVNRRGGARSGVLSQITLDKATARRSLEDLKVREPHAASSHGPPADRATERLEQLIGSLRV